MERSDTTAENKFIYTEAFSRNIGLLTPQEQEQIRNYTIAIPGMGGVGGAHLISLVRQGFERFKIADLDVFELKNFNRQYGAKMSNLGRPKTEVMREEALKINPRCAIEIFSEGIAKDNISDFLDGVDLGVDALDAFVIDERRLFITEAQKRKIPVVSAGPIGFGTAFLIFMPSSPSFDEFFSINDSMPYEKKLVAFFVGLIPKLLQRSYMRRTNLKERRGPSSSGAINLCAGVVTIYAIKILLKKGKIRAVPYYHQYDIMKEKYVSKRLWFGNRGPIQRIKLFLLEYLTRD